MKVSVDGSFVSMFSVNQGPDTKTMFSVNSVTDSESNWFKASPSKMKIFNLWSLHDCIKFITATSSPAVENINQCNDGDEENDKDEKDWKKSI